MRPHRGMTTQWWSHVPAQTQAKRCAFFLFRRRRRAHAHTHTHARTHSHKLLQSQYQMIFEEQEDHVVFDVKSQENKLDHTHASSSKLMQQLMKMQKVQANQNAILSRRISYMQYPSVKSNIFNSRCSVVVSDAIYLDCNIVRVTQYIWAAIFSE